MPMSRQRGHGTAEEWDRQSAREHGESLADTGMTLDLQQLLAHTPESCEEQSVVSAGTLMDSSVVPGRKSPVEVGQNPDSVCARAQTSRLQASQEIPAKTQHPFLVPTVYSRDCFRWS